MEHEVLLLLKRSPGTRFSHKEIGRVIDRRQYRDDSHWARPILERLVREKEIDKEDCLYYFLERKEKDKERVCRLPNPTDPSNVIDVEVADET